MRMQDIRLFFDRIYVLKITHYNEVGANIIITWHRLPKLLLELSKLLYDWEKSMKYLVDFYKSLIYNIEGTRRKDFLP